jgi:acyl-[acyl-carrier-protein] desaturase
VNGPTEILERSSLLSADLENGFYELYLEFFNRAETERRWNIQKDIPWEKCNPAVDEPVAFIVESFMAVELYVPDYTSRILELVRKSRGRAWFQANWGYEESKHSMVLEQWLLRSGKRTLNDLNNFSEQVLQREWSLPFETPRQMLIYTTFQEFSTSLNYRKLRHKAIEQNDPALTTLLGLVARDESAHYHFFQDGLKLYLKENLDQTLADIKFVISRFRMPAQDLIPDWEHRGQAIVGQKIFSDRIFLKDVVRPILSVLGTSWQDLKALGVSDDTLAACVQS